MSEKIKVVYENYYAEGKVFKMEIHDTPMAVIDTLCTMIDGVIDERMAYSNSQGYHREMNEIFERFKEDTGLDYTVEND